MSRAFAFPEKEPEAPDLILTAEQVLDLPIGSRVAICGKNSHGEDQETVCIVAGHPTRKFLTYRTESGMIRRCAISDYPGKHYRKVVCEP